MNVRDSLLIALPALVLGLGVGYLFSSQLDSPAESQAAEASGPLRPSSAASPATNPVPSTNELASAPVVRAPLDVSAEVSTPRVSETELKRAMDTVAAPTLAALSGTGAIAGQVIDASGTALPGVVIRASRRSASAPNDPTKVGAGAPNDDSLEEYLRDVAQTWAERRAGRRSTKTDANGRFQLTDLPVSGRYNVSAYLEGFVVAALGSSYSVSPGQTLTFQAQGVHTIPVRLVFEGGGAPTKGAVGVKRGNNETLYAWSADEPALRMTAGRVSVRGYSGLTGEDLRRGGTDSDHASEEVSMDVLEQANTPLELVLKPRSGIRGRVIDDFGSGGDTGSLVVRLLRLESIDELDTKELAESDRQARLSGSRFEFLDLSPGTYALGLTNRNESLFTHQVVTVGAEVLETELVVPEPNPDEHLVVRAFGPTGSPLQDLDFRWQRKSGGGSSSGGIQGRRGEDGAYWLRPKDEFFKPWDGATYRLTVEHSELGDRAIDLTENQREVSVTFDEPISIIVVVAGYAGSRYEGQLDVQLSHVEDGAAQQQGFNFGFGARGRNSVFSPEGVARFDSLAPGTWKVSLLVKSDSWRSTTAETTEVQVTAGETEVRMSLPELYDLAVVAPGLSKGTWLWLQKADSEERGFGSNNSNANLDDDHRAYFKNLAAGSYVLSGNGLDSVDVTVPCGELFLDAKEPNCLRVAIGDLEGLLYTSGLRAGDLIIGTDGKEFTSTQNSWNLLQGEGQVSLIVLRGSERLSLSMDRATPGPDWFASLGGMLTPASRP